MADLLASTETTFDTDFAILSADQSTGFGATAGGFAGSAVGSLAAMCGTKYARVRVRAERWSARPEFDNGWEDFDELPFEALEDAGPLCMSGFDPPADDHGLDLGGFEMGRVQIMARGRQRYGYSDGLESGEPEEWLIRLYPEPGPARPLSGGPRRLSGSAPFGVDRNSAWAAAVHGWDQTGWHSHLFSFGGYYAVRLGLLVSQHAISRRALAEVSQQFVRIARAELPADALDTPIEPSPLGPERLATLSGLPTGTLGESIEALIGLGLLLPFTRRGETVLVPNPDPGMVWDRATMTEQEILGARTQIGYSDYRQIADDLKSMADWSPTGLSTTVRELAIRLSEPTTRIQGGLELLTLTAPGRFSRLAGHPALEDGDIEFTF